MIYQVKEPTGEECSLRSLLGEDEDSRFYATWYPQMGGYSGKAVVAVTKGDSDSCFTVWVWHDGEFPFGDDDERRPARLHHCMVEQFAQFAKDVQSFMEAS